MLIFPKDYCSPLDLRKTQEAIKFVKDTFQVRLAKALNLHRVSAPLFVRPETGLNDNLNGVERPVSFDAPPIGGGTLEIVHSLAKWKRMTLGRFKFLPGEGLYTDMNAIRRDEDLDAIHSIYVDQWDWEKIIDYSDRNLDYLFQTVRTIYEVIKKVNTLVKNKFLTLTTNLPSDIKFISTSELLEKYPNLTAKEREDAIVKEYKAVFLYQIGWPLKNGKSHDGRAADYDDWDLNGDILVWNDVIQCAFELSSMGIRVDETSLVKQLTEKNEMEKIENEYCQNVINKVLPLTIGGGIGQSRLCMFMLQKAHIGEVQVSVWPEEIINELNNKNIKLL